MIRCLPLTTGAVFSRLTVMALNGYAYSPGGTKRRVYLCKCVCGAELSVRENLLKNGNTKSCGCLQKERTSTANRKHGQRYSKESGTGKSLMYMLWLGMKARCECVSNKDYPRYGARGIYVCEAWQDFKQFYADMGERPDGLQLERKDNDGPYCKSNCCWATVKQQANNRRTTRTITYGDRTQTVSDWAHEIGITHSALYQRIFKNKWPLDKALRQRHL